MFRAFAPETIAHAFVEIRPLLGHCRFRDCRHDREPGCAVWQAVEAGKDASFGDIYVCPVCGYTMEGSPPDTCPICNAKKASFKKF